MVDHTNVDELLEYKKTVLRDDRRESRIRDSIEQTLEFINNKRRSTFHLSFDNNNNVPSYPAYPSNPAAGPAPPFNNLPKPQYVQAPPPNYISAPLALSGPNDMAGRNYDIKKDIEKLGVYDVSHGGGGGGGGGHGGGHGHGHHEEVDPSTVDWRIRLKHFTFAWFASTMSTGGVAGVLAVVPNKVPFVIIVGTIMYVLEIVLFLAWTTLISIRFMMHPGTLKNAFTNPHEGFFSATFWLTVATIINNAVNYGVPKTGTLLVEPLRIAFWIYTICATAHAIIYYHVLFTVKKLVITNVLPGWLLPVFPAMLVGTLASTIAKTQPAEHAFPMLVAGLSFQGLGMLMAMMIFSIFMGRLLTAGLPIDLSRPAMFIAVGPPAFTALAIIGMSQDVVDLQIFSTYTTLPGIRDQNMIYDVLQIGSLLGAIFLWMLAAFFFAIATIATFEAIHRNDFHLNWHAYVFPNVGFTIATIQIGNRLNSPAIQIVGTIMAGTLFFLWVVVVYAHIKAFFSKNICWPGKDEDAH